MATLLGFYDGSVIQQANAKALALSALFCTVLLPIQVTGFQSYLNGHPLFTGAIDTSATNSVQTAAVTAIVIGISFCIINYRLNKRGMSFLYTFFRFLFSELPRMSQESGRAKALKDGDGEGAGFKYSVAFAIALGLFDYVVLGANLVNLFHVREPHCSVLLFFVYNFVCTVNTGPPQPPFRCLADQ